MVSYRQAGQNLLLALLLDQHATNPGIVEISRMSFILFAILIGVTGAASLSQETPNLRGVAGEGHVRPFGDQELRLAEKEAVIAEFLKNLPKPSRDASKTSEKLERASGESLLNYYGGNPGLSYNGYMLIKVFRPNDETCHGEPESVFGQQLPCQSYGEGSGSIGVGCGRQNGHTVLRMGYFASDDCTGPAFEGQISPVPPCMQGMSIACVAHDSVPRFARKDSLMTYVFPNVSACMDFSSYYLNYNPYVADDAVEFDDKLDTLGQMIFGGPMSDVAGGGAGHKHTDPVALSADTSAGAAAADGTKRTTSTTSASTTTPTTEASLPARDANTNTNNANNAKEELVVTAGPPYREIGFKQLRNNICSLDEKYGLHVRTSCHGLVNKIAYYVFADSECKRPIKRVVHDLDQRVPHYGMCVPSAEDERAILTVCHNDAEPAPIPPAP